MFFFFLFRPFFSISNSLNSFLNIPFMFLSENNGMHAYIHCILNTSCCSVTQLCPTLCSPLDSSLPNSSLHRIFRQVYWSEMPFPTLPNPGIEPKSAVSLPLGTVIKRYTITLLTSLSTNFNRCHSGFVSTDWSISSLWIICSYLFTHLFFLIECQALWFYLGGQ